MNDGDSFLVKAGRRELHLRLYYVDCPETTYGSPAEVERVREQQRISASRIRGTWCVSESVPPTTCGKRS